MPNTPVRPIAVLARTVHDGIIHVLNTLGDNVKEYSNHRRRVFSISGQEYLVIDSLHILRGCEFSDFMIAPGFGNHPDAEQMTSEIGMRIRK